MKRIFLIATIALAVLLTGLSTILFCAKLNVVHQFVISRVNNAIPGAITIGALHLSFFDMKVVVKDCSLADSSGKKLAGFSRLLVDISTLGLLRKAMIVEKTVLEDPYALLEFDSSGHLSLLNAFLHGQAKSKDTASGEQDSTSKPFLFELRDLNIIGGKIHFAAAEQDSLKIQAYGLSIKAKGETGTLSGDLTIAFDSSALEKNGENLHLYDLSLMTRMRNMEIDTVDLRIHTGNSSLKLNGRASSLTDNPLVNLSVAADLALSEIGPIAGLKEALSGNTKLRMHLSGKASNPDFHLDVTYEGGTVWGYPIKSLFLKSQLTDRVLELNPLHADAQVGSVDVVGSVNLSNMFPKGFLSTPGSVQELRYDLAISGKGIPLKKLAPGLSGTAAMSIALHGKGAHPDSLAANLGISASIAALQLDTSSLPLDAAVACSAEVVQGIARVHSLAGNLGSTNLSLTGLFGLSSGNMKAALALTVPQLGEILKFTGTDSISGSADISIDVGGDLKNPQAGINLKADSLSLCSVRIGNITLSAGLEKNGTAWVKDLALTNKDSQIKLSGSAHVLHRGIPVPVDSIIFDLSLSSHGLLIEDFMDSISGTVDLNADVKGTIKDPHGQIQLSGTDLFAAGQNIAEIGLNAILEQQRIIIQPLLVAIEPGQDLTITGWASMKDSFDIALSSKGIHLNTIAALTAVDSLQGIFTVDLQAGGTYTEPLARGKLGVGSISMGTLKFDDIGLQLDLHNKQLEVTGKAVGDIHAGYNLDTKAFWANLDLNDLLLTPYLALSGQSLDGALTAAIKVFGNADTLAAITGDLNIASLVINYKDIRIIETHKLNASMKDNRYSVPEFKIALAGEGSLKGHAQGPINGPHDVALSGTVPLTIVRHFSPDLPDIEGSIIIDASLKGTPKDPDLRADVQLRNIGMTVPGLSQRLHSLNGRILANPKSVSIERLQGNLDNGVISMTGDLKLDELAPSDLRADIRLKHLPVGVPDMLDLVLDAKLHIAGTPDTTRFTGDIFLLDGLYFQDLVINPLVGMGQRKRKEPSHQAENTTPYLRNMRFDVGVQARSPFRVDNNIAQLTIAPDLQLTGSIQAPALNGRANVEQGTITYQKKVFTVERGVIDFVNPYAIEPQIDINGTVPVRDWLIQIVISGTPDNLVFKLTSDDPGLEDQDLLSLLVLGKTTTELQSGDQLSGGGQSNQQMLASLVASTFGDDIKKATGLDILQIETGNQLNENSDRIAVTMGKQVTKRLGTKYTVESQEGEVVQRATAEYRILQNLNIAGFQDTKGVYGGELRLTWERR